ncbi:hypothetical protein B0H15DRAFT_947087 [Mycena belliarum]|uniref:Uncharacterized protein n=1 Tax=Mycena belliarum TaxID=1033014 RepID=A0AAD6U885_9AGAR|nr:hypothetical protein B0H15DRAFT_947087 [Mycena belliae]
MSIAQHLGVVLHSGIYGTGSTGPSALIRDFSVLAAPSRPLAVELDRCRSTSAFSAPRPGVRTGLPLDHQPRRRPRAEAIAGLCFYAQGRLNVGWPGCFNWATILKLVLLSCYPGPLLSRAFKSQATKSNATPLTDAHNAVTMLHTKLASFVFKVQISGQAVAFFVRTESPSSALKWAEAVTLIVRTKPAWFAYKRAINLNRYTRSLLAARIFRTKLAILRFSVLTTARAFTLERASDLLISAQQ